MGRLLLVVLLFAPAVRAAELKTLKGEVIAGELAGLTDKEIVLLKGGERIATPVAQVVTVDFGPPGKVSSDVKFIDIELTDGSVLHCSQFVIKEKNIDMTLLAGQELKLPLSAIANILNDAHIEKNRKDWTERLSKRRRRDVLAAIKDGVVNPLEGTLGEGDAEGKNIGFTLASGRKASVPLANVFGLIFQRGADPGAAPVICKLFDSHKNVLFVSGLASTATGLIATTPSGAKIEYTTALLSRLDFSRDKLAYLSDMEPSRVNESSTEERIEHYRKDKNLDDGPIRLGGVPFAKGIALHANTELEFDLKGEFREFKATAGIDDLVGGIDGPTLLRIEGDGKELYSLTISRKDKERSRPVTLNIKDVQKLKISVTSGDLLDLGKHLTLGDAKVSK